MIEYTYRVLGYYRLLDILSQYAACPLGRSDCLSLKPLHDQEKIDNELRLVSEMRLLLKTQGFVSLNDVMDVVPLIVKSRIQGGYLEPEEILVILCLAEASRQVKKFIRARKALFPRLYDLTRGIPYLDGLIDTLKKAVSPNGTVLDSASPRLRQIRQEKIRLRQAIEKKLEAIRKSAGISDRPREQIVTIRDGRYVVSLRTERKSRIEGIVHDYSQTKATCFLEPVAVIQDNNHAAELAREEKTEIFRILTYLTERVKDMGEALERTRHLMARIDGIHARAAFSEAQSCIMPEIGQGCGIELRGARNPLLLAMALNSGAGTESIRAPVPVDILLDGQHNVLVISGPNRGGKTVTLKTLGLMSLMAQAGMHIPAEEGSRLPVFEHVMADIGDDQDIRTGLSTFSAHAAHLSHILRQAHPKTLVIIDEPGMGTDPDEGVALSMAVIDFLSGRGAFVAVSTHSNRLKAYGVSNERAVNASVEFDDLNNRPTFRLLYGVPGISHALQVAREMGVPSNILDSARAYLDRGEVRLNRLIEKTNHLRLEAEQEKIATENMRAEYMARTKELETRILSLEREKQTLIAGKRREAEAAIQEAKEELKQVINLLKMKKTGQASATEEHAEIARRLMDQLKEDSEHEARKPRMVFSDFKNGRIVYHRKLKKSGIIHSVDVSSGRVSVMLGNIKVSAGIQDVEIIKDNGPPETRESGNSVTWHITSPVPRELNVIGYRVADAIPLIDRTIDRALVDGESTLRIIHGFGTGRLKDAIRGHLRKKAFVKNICSADSKFGGDAITIVEL